MINHKLLLTALSTLSLLNARADIVATFDDLPDTDAPMPQTYMGLNWDRFYVYPINGQLQYQAYQAPSGLNIVGPGFNPRPTITSDTPFNFIGASFIGDGAPYADSEDNSYPGGNLFGATALTLNLIGYRDNVAVASTQINLLSQAFNWQWFQADMNGIDRLDIWGLNLSGYDGYWFMDNFTFSTVPECSTLFAGALCLVLFMISLGKAVWRPSSPDILVNQDGPR